MDASVEAPQKPGVVVVKLKQPIQFGSELIEELEIKWSARAVKDLSIPITEDGGVLLQPYPLAVAGLKMAGKSPAALVDKLSGVDMMEVARVVMGFLN